MINEEMSLDGSHIWDVREASPKWVGYVGVCVYVGYFFISSFNHIQQYIILIKF